MSDDSQSLTRPLRKPEEYKTIDLIRRRNHLFFARETMAHFGTKIESGAYDKGLFITSEKPEGLELDRAYTVRRALDLYDTDRNVFRPNILNVAGGFMAHATLAEAQAALEAHLVLLNLSGRPLLAAMSRSVGKAAGFTAIGSRMGGFTLICSDAVNIMQVQKLRETAKFEQEICRVDFRSESDAKKVLGAGLSPVAESWIANIIFTARGIPVGPVNLN